MDMAERGAGTIDPVLTVPPGVDDPPAGPLRQVLRPRWRAIAVWVGVLVAVAIVLDVVLPTPRAREVRVVDPKPSIAAAQGVAGFPLFLPSPLPAGWHPDSARFDRTGRLAPLLHIGYLAPDGGYAGLEETTTPRLASFGAVMSAGGVVVGVDDIDGAYWVEEQSNRKPQTTLVWYGSHGAVLVTGTTSLANLQALAASLHVHVH